MCSCGCGSGTRVVTRGALHDADQERPVTASRNATSQVGALAPGGRAGQEFVIRTTIRVLGLADIGVYPLDVEARGNAGDGFHPLGLAPTWLPFFAGGRASPTRVAVAWPLVDRPHQRADGSFLDDDLDTDLAGNGRLGRALAAAATAAIPQCERWGASRGWPPVVPAARCEPVRVTYARRPRPGPRRARAGGDPRVEAGGKPARRAAVPLPPAGSTAGGQPRTGPCSPCPTATPTSPR